MISKSQSAVAYDFTSPGHKINKQWPVLEIVNEKIASNFSTAISERLQISLVGVAPEATRKKYSECIQQMGKTCLVHEISLAPLEGSIWFCMDISVLSVLVDCYFGGEALLEPLEEARELSRTEHRVLKHILVALEASITDAWSMVMPIKASILRAMDVDRLANNAMDEVMVSSEIDLQLGAAGLPCHIIYPFEMLKPIGDRLEYEASPLNPQDMEFSQALQGEVMNCELDIRGVLTEMPITLGKLLDLKPGDFIPLRDVQTVSFKTDNIPLFDARVGHSNGRVSASLSRWHLPVSH